MKRNYTKFSLVWVLLYGLSFMNGFATISSEEKGKEKDKKQIKGEKPKDKEHPVNPIANIGIKPSQTRLGKTSAYRNMGADPFIFTITSAKDYAGVGEEVELTIKVSWADFGVNNGVKFLPEWYNYTLKVITPKGFSQTGGDYSDYCTKLVNAQNPTATFTLKGQFEYNDDNAVFTVLRGFEGANATSEFIYKTEKKFTVNRMLQYNSQMGIGLSNPKIAFDALPRSPKNKSAKTNGAGEDCELRVAYEDLEDLDPNENIAPVGWESVNGIDVQVSGTKNMFDAGIRKYLAQASEDYFYYPNIPGTLRGNSPNQVAGFVSTGKVSVYQEYIINKFQFTVGANYYLEFEQAVVANADKNDKPYFEIRIGDKVFKSTPMTDYNGFIKQKFGPFNFNSAEQIVKITGIAPSYYSYMLLDNFNIYKLASNDIVRNAPITTSTIDEACLQIILNPGFDSQANSSAASKQDYRTRLHGQN
jgi:hypothetical protein